MLSDDRRRSLARASEQSAIFELAFIALANGLLEELDREDGVTADELADATETDAAYVARWLDAAFAYELVDLGAEEETFRLTELGRAFRPDAEETMMPMAVQAILSARLSDRLASLMATGDQPGEELLGEFENVTPWFGAMLEARFRPLFLEYVLSEIDLFQKVDARGGLVVDLGCGNGWYLRELAATFEKIRGIGVDSMEENIEAAREETRRAELRERLEFRLGNLLEFEPEEPVDVVVLNRTLHHVWEERERLFEVVERLLMEGGAAIVWEPAFPTDRSELRDPDRRGLAVRNLAEHAMGNRLLQPEEIEAQFEAVGMTSGTVEIADTESLVVGRKS